MSSKLTIRSKLAAALALPLAAFAALAGVQVSDALRDVERAEAQADVATAAIGPSGVLTALQNERNFETLRVIGAEAAVDLTVDSSEEARAATDDAVRDFAQRLDELDVAARDAYESAVVGVRGTIDRVRATGDQLAATASLEQAAAASDLFGSYTEVIAEMLDANTSAPLTIDDAELRTGVELLDALSRLNDVEARIVRSAGVAGVLKNEQAAIEVQSLVGLQAEGEHRVRALSDGPWAASVRAVLEHPDRKTYVDSLRATAADPFATDLDALLASVPEGPGQLRSAEGSVASLVGARADAVRGEATDRVQWYTLVAAASVLLAILVIVLANVWITRPLRRLAREAHEMADERLPAAVRAIFEEHDHRPEVQPVRVRGGAEVAGVVHALNAVQESAIQLADEQSALRRGIADSFVNLGRRNQHLIARQLDLITELEQDEPDGERLGQLFSLDHLATRMRRNAESLLVLAGEHPPRQWHEPVEIVDVVRAALGEVEQYRRVEIQALDDARVVGHAVADISHLVAELLENALTFSPPEAAVEVYGRETADGYALTVVDHGMGMPDDAIDAANERLRSDQAFTVTPARYLGHYVVARLAARHGVDVALTATPGGGTSATVALPVSVLDGREPVAPPTDEHAEAPSTVDAPVEFEPPAEITTEPEVEPALAVAPVPLAAELPVAAPAEAGVEAPEEAVATDAPADDDGFAATFAAPDDEIPFELAPAEPYADLMDLAPDDASEPEAPAAEPEAPAAGVPPLPTRHAGDRPTPALPTRFGFGELHRTPAAPVEPVAAAPAPVPEPVVPEPVAAAPVEPEPAPPEPVLAVAGPLPMPESELTDEPEGGVEAVADAVAELVAPASDDLLPRLPKRRLGRGAPAVRPVADDVHDGPRLPRRRRASEQPVAVGVAASFESDAHDTPAPPDTAAHNVALFAAFRSASDRGRADAARSDVEGGAE